ncbi:hypothetical protein [Cellulosilyticum sp. I15G10I2]|uniref:hypothetical protein n=1 Tax=Cellulosilyticum sp. I15G10I2 TaxID=1892843 RepID=UPI00085C5FEC|nr:hypothetical protein [Cellulosilyticum sp. I15G10I2]
MKIINQREFYFKAKQIKKFLKLFDEAYRPETIIIYEKRRDLFKNLLPIGLSFLPILFGRTEGFYNMGSDTICLFVFSENDDGEDKQSFQLYTLHALCHELRHRFQYMTNRIMSEEDADNFATEFMDKNSRAIKNIMKWEDEWEVEEY